jgi:hypothetical protein
MGNPNGGPPETRFKPGNPGGGRPKGIITATEVRALMGRFWSMSVLELREVIENPKSRMGELMVAAVMLKAYESGDYSRLAFLLDRSVGKVKEEIEQTVRSITDEDLDKIPRDALIKLVSGQK